MIVTVELPSVPLDMVIVPLPLEVMLLAKGTLTRVPVPLFISGLALGKLNLLPVN